MWTRSKTPDGKFEYSLYDVTGELVETIGGFDTHTAADRAAEMAQRRALFGLPALDPTTTIDDISDEDLLALLS